MSPKRSVRALAGLATAAVIVVLPASSYAFAKGGNGGGKGGPAATTLSCFASPSPVTVGSDYTLNATGLPANTYVSVYVTDQMGTQWTNGQTDASGAVSVLEHASYSGNYTAKITSGSNTSQALASCSFSAS